ncbi:S8 family serine peptidase [Streptococcus mitis]|uniref:S8 family serine peptidase n=1 Tax=Streptococcus mitis TaxID=28037 RepID=UPI0021B7E819
MDKERQLRFSFRKLAIGLISCGIGLFWTGEVSAYEQKANITYQYVTINELSEQEKEQIVLSLPDKVTENATYYLVYKPVKQTNEQSLPKTGNDNSNLVSLLGLGLIVVAVSVGRRNKKTVSSILILGTTLTATSVSAITVHTLENYGKTVTLSVGSELPKEQLSIAGYEFVGYIKGEASPVLAPVISTSETSTSVSPLQTANKSELSFIDKTTVSNSVQQEKIETVVKERKESLPFSKELIYDDTLEVGKEELVREGTEGIQIVNVTSVLKDGVIISSSEEIISTVAPINELVRVGTKQVISSDNEDKPQSNTEANDLPAKENVEKGKTPEVIPEQPKPDSKPSAVEETVISEIKEEQRIREVRRDVTNFETLYRDDDTLAEGTEIEVTAGKVGYTVVTVTEIVRDGQVVSSKEDVKEIVPPVNRVVTRGTRKQSQTRTITNPTKVVNVNEDGVDMGANPSNDIYYLKTTQNSEEKSVLENGDTVITPVVTNMYAKIQTQEKVIAVDEDGHPIENTDGYTFLRESIDKKREVAADGVVTITQIKTRTYKQKEIKPTEKPEADGDGSYIKSLEANHIAKDEETGIEFVDNQIIISTRDGISKEEVERLASKYKMGIVGHLIEANYYQLELSQVKSYLELKKLVEDLHQNPMVRTVELNNVQVYDTKSDKTDMAVSTKQEVGHTHAVEASTKSELEKPNDPFGDDMDGWDEENPSGDNWGLEVIRARQAWKLLKDENKGDIVDKNIVIGVVEPYIQTYHEDLNIVENVSLEKHQRSIEELRKMNKDKIRDAKHGMHVAGIIGAKKDNGIGIVGVAPNIKILDDSLEASSEYLSIEKNEFNKFSTMEEYFIFYRQIFVGGAKIINYSRGYTPDSGITYSASKGNAKAQQDIKDLARDTAVFFEKLLEKKDFLIVTSAGNDNNIKYKENSKKDFGYEYEKGESADSNWIDSQWNSDLNATTPEISQDVYNRIIVVGSIDNEKVDGNYKLSSFSNTGARVDVVAPGGKSNGKGIYSSSINSRYTRKEGTSMAAPYVSGIAALVWSANPKLTGEQVKNIIIRSASGRYSEVHDNLKYPIANAEEAVRLALNMRESDSIGTIRNYYPTDKWKVVQIIDGVDFHPDKFNNAEVFLNLPKLLAYEGKGEQKIKLKWDTIWGRDTSEQNSTFPFFVEVVPRKYLNWNDAVRYPTLTDKNVITIDDFPNEYPWDTAKAFNLPEGITFVSELYDINNNFRTGFGKFSFIPKKQGDYLVYLVRKFTANPGFYGIRIYPISISFHDTVAPDLKINIISHYQGSISLQLSLDSHETTNLTLTNSKGQVLKRRVITSEIWDLGMEKNFIWSNEKIKVEAEDLAGNRMKPYYIQLDANGNYTRK